MKLLKSSTPCHLLHQNVRDTVHRVVVHVAIGLLLPAPLHPHLQQVLVEGVSQRSEGNLLTTYQVYSRKNGAPVELFSGHTTQRATGRDSAHAREKS